VGPLGQPYGVGQTRVCNTLKTTQIILLVNCLLITHKNQ
jgi:hypothetical protein